MKNLQITAHLASAIAVYDDWTPQLEGVLIYQLLSNLGLAHPNPSLDQIKDCDQIIRERLPIKRNSEHGFYYCSNPVYCYKCEQQSRFRKRWSPDQDGNIKWGKRKAKFDTSQGAEKSYDLPLFLRVTPRIDWFCIGNPDEVKSLLDCVTGLGKKRSQGFGQVCQWDVTEIDQDWSLVKDKELMKPVSGKVYSSLDLDRFYNVLKWGWKPPVWLPENQALCFMPEVVKLCS
jgi:hypothetical protein